MTVSGLSRVGFTLHQREGEGRREDLDWIRSRPQGLERGCERSEKLTSVTMAGLSVSPPQTQGMRRAGVIKYHYYPTFISPSSTPTVDDPSLMLLTIFPSHIPMTVPRGHHLKRSRGPFARSHKLSHDPRQRIHETDPSIIAPTDPRSSTRLSSAINYQSQPRPVSHRHRSKRRRLSANCPGVLQNHLPIPSHPKPVFPTPPPSSSAHPSPPSSDSQTDEEDRLSVISERLRLKMSNSSSTAAYGNNPASQLCTYEDWQDIKELFAKAAEQYNGKHVPNIF